MHHSPASVVLRAQCDVPLVTGLGCVCKEAIEHFFHSRVHGQGGVGSAVLSCCQSLLRFGRLLEIWG